MEKPILYCDCDGVIFNTIDVAFQMMKEKGYDIDDRIQRNAFFKNEVDWNKVFEKAVVINDSIEKIKLLKESNIFSDIVILTKLSGRCDEERLKRAIFGDMLPDTKVVTLQFDINKSSIVAYPENHILIDDEKRNCIDWRNNDGTAILFSQKANNLENNIINDLMDIPNTEGVKKLLKTRNF